MKAPLLFFASFIAATGLAHAQTQVQGSAAPPPPLSPIEQSIKDIKNPFDWLSWGADLRVRDEYFDNILTLSPNNPLHEQDYMRFRARLWTSIKPVEDLSLNARLATEPREWFRPAGYTPFKGRSGFDATEGVVDNLNVQWKNILSQPITLTVGRQDILWGDGWLLGDGTPYDGSWTYFVDSARMTYELKDQHTTIEAIGIIQDAKDDGWLQTINDQDRFYTEQNEKGAIVSINNSSIKEANLTGYFVYKEDAKANAFDPVHNPAPRGGDNANIYTVGGRVNGLVGGHWKYWAEGAYQFGRKQDATIAFPSPSSDYRDISAFGFNGRFGYLFKDPLNNQVQFSYEFLSGDDPGTKGDEMFDVLWGRWPRWSEIGLYSYAAETRIGQEANLHRFGPGWSFTPLKNLDFSAAYYALFAPQEVPTREASPSLFTRSGNFRGHFAQAVLKYKFSQHLSGHLWAVLMFPGDYYASRQTWYFFRPEVMLTF